jgi:GT2 family glycosyltransferase/glycosyltransferase involved in cell wall biosynthesis
MRRGMKAAWWIATPWRIPARLRLRRQLLDGCLPIKPGPQAASSALERQAPLQPLVGNRREPLNQTPPSAHHAPPPAVFDRFALHVIPRLQGDYMPVVCSYDPYRPEVSIIVLNWNRSEMTLLCLQHLWQNTSGHHYEIIVVDNGSASEDLKRLRDRASYARIIPLGVNRFFGEANNIGVEAARGQYVCLLNNDAFVSPGWLDPLVQILVNNPKAGAVGPSFRYPNGSLQEAGALVNSDGSIIQLGKGGRADDPNFNTVRIVDYTSAACMLLRRDDFMRVLGFDLAFEPAYYEDVDLCLKLRLIGLQTFHCPGSIVTHIENATASTEGAALRLDNVVAINRQKFVVRWGRYLETMGREKLNLVPALSAANVAPNQVRRVLIYMPYLFTPGGGERYILTIAQAFKGYARVALVTPCPISRIRLLTLGREFGLDIYHVDLLSIQELSAQPPFDLAFVLGNEIFPPVGRMGLRNIFICQFPFPLHSEEYGARARPFWNEFDLILTYSEFVRSHVAHQARERKLPARRVEILAPPAALMPLSRTKKPRQILHVGRFFAGGHCKKQDAMIEAFRILVGGSLPAELHFAGATMPGLEHSTYYAGLVERARDLPVHFHPNCSRADIQRLYAESAIYWHATGLGEDIENAPHAAEHFGISVVEAMSARCIPIVFAAGGPATIVVDGITGFHFHTLEQLVLKTRQVLEETSTATLDAIADAAVAAAQAFDEQKFEENVRRISFELIAAQDAEPALAAANLRE